MFRRTSIASKNFLFGSQTPAALAPNKKSWWTYRNKQRTPALKAQLNGLLETIAKKDSKPVSKTEAEAIRDAAAELALVAASAEYQRKVQSPVPLLPSEQKTTSEKKEATESDSNIKKTSKSAFPGASKRRKIQKKIIAPPLEAATVQDQQLSKVRSTKKRMPIVTASGPSGKESKSVKVPASPLARSKLTAAARRDVEENGYSSIYDVYTVQNKESEEARKEKELTARLMQLEEEVKINSALTQQILSSSPATTPQKQQASSSPSSALTEPRVGEVSISLDAAAEEPLELSVEDQMAVSELEKDFGADFLSTFDVYADTFEEDPTSASGIKNKEFWAGEVAQESVLAATQIGRTPFRGGVCRETGNGFFSCDLTSVTNNIGTNKEFVKIPDTDFIFCGYMIANFVSTWKLQNGLSLQEPQRIGSNLYFSCFNTHQEELARNNNFSDRQRKKAEASEDHWNQTLGKEAPVTTLVFSFDINTPKVTSKGGVSIGGFGGTGPKLSFQAKTTNESGSQGGGYVAFMNEPTYLLGGSFTVMRLEQQQQEEVQQKQRGGRNGNAQEYQAALDRSLEKLALEKEKDDYFEIPRRLGIIAL